MDATYNIDVRDIGVDDEEAPQMVSIDNRRLSPELFQEIVLLAGDTWLVWVSTNGVVLAAQRAPTA